MNSQLSDIAQIVFSRCEKDLNDYPDILKRNYDKQKYGLAVSNLKAAMECAIQMAMIAYTSTRKYEEAYSKLSLGKKYADELLSLCDRVASLKDDEVDRSKKIQGFNLAFVLIYCMLLKDYHRLTSVAFVMENNPYVVYESEELGHIGMMVKAFANDDKGEFQDHYQAQQSKKNRSKGYDLPLSLCHATLSRDQNSFDSVLAEMENEYPKRKTSRAYKGIQSIWGGGEYNEIFFDFYATAIASYAKKLGMKVEPSSDVAIPAVFL